MRKLFAVLTLAVLPFVFAQQYSGTFVDPPNQATVTLQQQADGSIQGFITTPRGQFQLQGQGSGLGAYGTAESTQGILGFQAQMSQDGQTLQIVFYQADQNNQPVEVGGMILQRSTGQPGAFPGATQPGATQPTFPGATPPGATQPSFPGTTQPGGATPPFGGATQPGVTQPGAAQPTFPGTQPTGGQGGLSRGLVEVPVSDWNGAYVGVGGQLVMFVQSAGQPGSYTGYFNVAGQQYPLQATGDQYYLEGVYFANGVEISFYAEEWDGFVYLIDDSDDSEFILAPAGR